MKKFLRFLGISLLAFVILATIGAIAATVTIFWVSQDLPSFTRISDYRPPQVTTVFARDGSIIGYFYDEKRFLVSLGEMPPVLWQAFLAAEDADFYGHDGVSPKALLRATYKSIISGSMGAGGGGSTITQQLVKRLLLTPERKLIRKLKEIILAYRLENYLSKDEILTIYLNQIFLGSGAHGVEAAARVYFGKHVGGLTLPEAAVIAGLPQSPSKVNPYTNPAATKERQRYVLRRMLTVGFITQEEYEQAEEAELTYTSMPDPSYTVGAWYLEEVRRRLIDFLSEETVRDLGLPLDRYGKDALYNSGLNIHTSMEPVHQHTAETALRQGLLDTSKRHGWMGALQRLSAEEMDQHIAQSNFAPQLLDNAGWAKAVVVSVSDKRAEVRLGAYQGSIDAKWMTWCRVPNPNLAPEDGNQTRKPNQVLAVGDLIWVSAVGASGTANPVGAPENSTAGIAPYDSTKIALEKPIDLCLEQTPDAQGALVSVETETGDIVALVGGYNFSAQNQYNRATQAKRQPGSSFKPIVYSAALDNAYTAASIIEDAPFVSERIVGGDPTLWRPSNVDGVFYGPILLRTALVRSRNLCTIRVAQHMGIGTLIERARKLGIEGVMQPDLSISIGSHAVTPLNMAEVYTAFANNGVRVKPRLIQSISDNWGQAIVNFVPEKIDSITPQNAYIMSSMLKDVVTSTRRTRGMERITAGKTGTTNEERDAWFIGYSPYLVTTVYVGFDEPKPMGKFETGARVAAPIFTSYRKSIEELYPDEDFPMPPGIKIVSIDADNGCLAGIYSENVLFLPFYEGTEPKTVSGAPRKRGDDDVGSAVDLLKQ